MLNSEHTNISNSQIIVVALLNVKRSSVYTLYADYDKPEFMTGDVSGNHVHVQQSWKTQRRHWGFNDPA